MSGADLALATGRGPNIFRSKLTKFKTLMIDCTLYEAILIHE